MQVSTWVHWTLTLDAPFSDKEHQRLVQLAANWRSLLAFDDGAPKLADALEVFIAAYQQQSPDRERLHDEVVFQAGVYRMGHWTLVKHFIPSVTVCLDNFGSVLPKHREAFKRRYEADDKSVGRSAVATAQGPVRHDPQPSRSIPARRNEAPRTGHCRRHRTHGCEGSAGVDCARGDAGQAVGQAWCGGVGGGSVSAGLICAPEPGAAAGGGGGGVRNFFEPEPTYELRQSGRTALLYKILCC